MDTFLSRISDNITQHITLRNDAPIIVAVSGGADSVALLAALCSLGYTCVVAHCNFHLRGEESNRDMRSVTALSQRFGVDLYIKDFDVHTRCKQTGESLEMACRALRYEWFAQLLDRMRAQALAVAHHREDNIETFFINLMRGSSLTGLTGMRWRNDYIVRPMLNMSRTEIEDYLSREDIPYVNDSTNAESVFTRNKLRNIVLPVLTEQFPNAFNGILNSLEYLSENRELYLQTIREKSDLYMSGQVIHLSELVREQPLARLLLFEMIRVWGFNISQVDDILASADRSGIKFSAGSTTLELNRGVINIIGRTHYTADEIEVNLKRDILSPLHIIVADYPVTQFHPTRDPNVVYFDIKVLDSSPKFTLRRWRRGDRITPYGMRGTRLLSDIFSDAKLSAADKRNIWLLTRNDEIIWVVGLKATDRFTITPDTRRFIALTLKH